MHESTLRKRLNEFGETPSSQLTLDEFMNVDLDAMTEEQDPPSYKAARRRDRLAELSEGELQAELGRISDLEQKIAAVLEEQRKAREARTPGLSGTNSAAAAKLASVQDKGGGGGANSNLGGREVN